MRTTGFGRVHSPNTGCPIVHSALPMGARQRLLEALSPLSFRDAEVCGARGSVLAGALSRPWHSAVSSAPPPQPREARSPLGRSLSGWPEGAQLHTTPTPVPAPLAPKGGGGGGDARAPRRPGQRVALPRLDFCLSFPTSGRQEREGRQAPPRALRATQSSNSLPTPSRAGPGRAPRALAAVAPQHGPGPNPPSCGAPRTAPLPPAPVPLPRSGPRASSLLI